MRAPSTALACLGLLGVASGFALPALTRPSAGLVQVAGHTPLSRSQHALGICKPSPIQRAGLQQLKLSASESGEKAEGSKKGKQLANLNVATFAVNALLVGLNNVGLFGKSTAQVSFDHQTLMTPLAPFFGIWGFIYMAEAAFVLWQSKPKNRDSDLVQKGIGPWFSVACILQGAWTLFFAQEHLLQSSLVLAGVAGSLAKAHLGISKYRKSDAPKGDFLLTAVPIGVHAGWTFAALVVNLNAYVQSIGTSAHTQLITAVTSIIACVGGGAFATSKFRDGGSFVASVVWALFGILAKSDSRTDLLGKVGARRLAIGLLSSIVALTTVTLRTVRNRAAKDEKV